MLLIPGGKSIEKGLPWVLRALTKGRENSFAGSYHVDRVHELEQSQQADPQGNIFFMHHQREFGRIEDNAVDVGRAVEDIKRLTGASAVDVIAECRGTLEAREYVRQGGTGIRNLIELTPPNRGFPVQGNFAWLMSKLWPGERWGGYPLTDEGRDALGSFRSDWYVGPVAGNPLLRRLNSEENQANEKKVLNSITVLAGDGNNPVEGETFPGLPLPFWRGDGSVPLYAAVQPHAENFVFTGDRTGHQSLNRNPEALEKIKEVLLSDGHPVRDEHYLEELPSFAAAQFASAAWMTSLVGRITVATMAATSANFGPVGLTIGAVSTALVCGDGVRQVAKIARGTSHGGPLLTGVSATAKFVQGAGLVSAMLGARHLGLGLLGAGFVASALTN